MPVIAGLCQYRSLALALLLSLTALQSRAADPLSPIDIARTRQVDAAAISPDGQAIAYLLRVPRIPGKDKDGPAWSELHVGDLAGASRPFVSGEVSVGQVAWTPDGAAISFVAKLRDDEHECLYAIPLSGGEARRVLKIDQDVSGYSWSPDGREVAVLLKAPESEKRKKAREKGFKQEVFEEEFRPLQVLIYHNEIADEKGAASAPTSKPAHEPRAISISGSVRAVRWSPDGRRLAAKVSKTPQIDDEMMFSRVVLIDMQSKSPPVEVATVGKLGDFRFSPDGAHIALIGAADINDPREGRLYVAPVADGEPREVVPNYMGHITDIAWQDVDTVMFIGNEGCEATFGKVDIDGNNRKTILGPGGPYLTALSLAKDGQSGVFIAETPQHPAELFAMKHGDKGPRRLTNSNPWLDGKQLAKQEIIRHRARDGLELEGILIHPLDEQPGTRYPLVMIVHGGPEAHESNGWKNSHNRPGQTLAGRGFAVFFPNYRGSTGRGVEFSKLGQRDYAGKEFDDLVDAVDHLVSIGLVDKNKVGVTGGSYGGYATAWCATKFTERFAAGVMAVGLSDKISAFGTTDIPQEMYLVHARVWPWEDWNFYRERSPIAYAKGSKTPLLILYGKDDTRVHPSQSMELYRFLKVLNQAPVRLIGYPGEGHGFGKSSSRYDYSLRLIQWMEHYLKGPGGTAPEPDLDYGM